MRVWVEIADSFHGNGCGKIRDGIDLPTLFGLIEQPRDEWSSRDNARGVVGPPMSA